MDLQGYDNIAAANAYLIFASDKLLCKYMNVCVDHCRRGNILAFEKSPNTNGDKQESPPPPNTGLALLKVSSC